MVDVARVIAERDRILADPEFRPTRGWFEIWVLPVLQGLVEWFGQLPRAAHWAIIIGLAVTLLALLIHLYLTLVAQAAARSRSAASAQPGAPADPESRLDAATLAGRARDALASGLFAESVRLTWLAVLARLRAAGISAGGHGRADWEHVAAVRRSRPASTVDVETLAAEFQRVRFGGAAADQASASRCLGILDRLAEKAATDGI